MKKKQGCYKRRESYSYTRVGQKVCRKKKWNYRENLFWFNISLRSYTDLSYYTFSVDFLKIPDVYLGVCTHPHIHKHMYFFQSWGAGDEFWVKQGRKSKDTGPSKSPQCSILSGLNAQFSQLEWSQFPGLKSLTLHSSLTTFNPNSTLFTARTPQLWSFNN